MKKYFTYEEPHVNKSFTLDEMKTIYKEEVNKEEYQDFDIWLYDMLKSGVFQEIEENHTALLNILESYNMTFDNLVSFVSSDNNKFCNITINGNKTIEAVIEELFKYNSFYNNMKELEQKYKEQAEYLTDFAEMLDYVDFDITKDGVVEHFYY